jgi:crotonobetainyl-CoA:carnitine CoA-transferase CaiB-like acyl-CoA transferase
MPESHPILKGIRVLDCASYIAAPVAGTVLADFGADVIKIEAPGGDPYRTIIDNPGLPVADAEYHWHLDNRNKTSITLDLRNAAGHEVLARLIADCDVFITNFTRGAREKLKLRYDDLRPLNKRLIYASMTAYGETGPESDKTGFDSTAYWARSGLMHAVKPDPDGSPARSLPGQGDHPTGLALFGAIMLALFDRERTGVGAKVHTSLLANGLWANAFYAQAVLSGGTAPMRPVREAMPNALTNHYRCRDGHWFIMSIVNQEREWEKLCEALERLDLVDDERFRTTESRTRHAKALLDVLDATFAQRDWPEWRQRLDANRITFGVVGTMEDIDTDEQMHLSHAIRDAEGAQIGASRVVDTPIWVDGASKSRVRPAPTIDEHRASILSDAGFEDADIARLTSAGAFGR